MGIIDWVLGRTAAASRNRSETAKERAAPTTIEPKPRGGQAKRKDAKPSASKSELIRISGIPAYRKELLFLVIGEPPASAGSMVSLTMTSDGVIHKNTPDPSIIYSALPVSEKLVVDLPKMGYFPSYFKMTPDQRAAYLAWLCDVTKPIDIGYVFVYYYGLERHLIYGNFDGAVNEILLLRKYHDQGSFSSYSSSALIHGCLVRKRADVLMHLYQDLSFDYFGNSSLLLLHAHNLDLTPEMLVRLSLLLPVKGISRKYIRENTDLYREALLEELRAEFGRELYPFGNKYDLSQVKGISYPLFANIGLSDEIRAPSLPNLFHCEPFQREFALFFAKVHGRAKALKRIKRSRSTSGSSVESLRAPE